MKTTQAKYQFIYDDIKSKIENNILENNSKLPSEAMLSQEYETSLITIKKALKMLADNGYIEKFQGKGSFVKNINAKEVKIIGLVKDHFVGGFGAKILTAMENICEENGYKFMTLQSQDNVEKEGDAIDLFMKIGVKALVITPVHGEFYNEKILKLITSGFPLVFLDRYLLGIRASYVTSNNYKAAKDAMEYLYEKGHRKILLLKYNMEASTLTDRIRGAMDFVSEKGDMQLNIFQFDSDDINNDEKNIIELAENLKNYDCTAVLSLRHKLGLQFRHAAKRKGKRVPEDYSLITFDSNGELPDLEYFTHVKQDEVEMGRMAVKLVLDRINNPNEEVKNIMIDTTMVKKESVKTI